MHRYRAAIVAIVIASVLVFVGNAFACSPSDPTARRSLACGIAPLSDFDRSLGVLRSEWDAAFAILQRHQHAYDHAAEEQVASIKVEIRRDLEHLKPDNPAASVIAAMLLLQDADAFGSRERRALSIEVVSALTSAADRGSLSGMALLIALFTESKTPIQLQLPDEAAACWRSARREFDVLDDRSMALDERRMPPPDDPRLWAGRACIAPTLEALRN